LIGEGLGIAVEPKREIRYLARAERRGVHWGGRSTAGARNTARSSIVACAATDNSAPTGVAGSAIASRPTLARADFAADPRSMIESSSASAGSAAEACRSSESTAAGWPAAIAIPAAQGEHAYDRHTWQ
jgi:hypothetical protein